jgi:ssDNA-binding replication factor A large subunit
VLSRKDQQQLTKRDIFLMDKSATEIRYTLWGEDAMNFSVQQGIVIGIKGALVREFNGNLKMLQINYLYCYI